MNQRFETNNRKLFHHGAIQTARSGVPEGPNFGIESLSALQLPLPAELIIRNLDKATALTLARELSRQLDDSSEENVLDRASLLESDLGEASRNSLKGEPILWQAYPAEGDFTVLVGEEGTGKYSLLADTRNELKERDPGGGRRTLHLGFTAVMSELELRLPLPPEDEKFPPISDQLRQIHIPREKMIGEVRDDVSNEKEKDLEKVQFLMKLFGFDDSLSPGAESIMDLWESRNEDEIAMIDLFLHMLSKKQELANQDVFPRNTVKDLRDTADFSKSPLDIRRDQEEESIETLISLGFGKADIERRFQLAPSEKEKLKLRYVAWLARQPYMGIFRKEVKGALKEGYSVANPNLFAEAVSQTQHLHNEHVRSRYVNYNLAVGYEADDYNRKRELLKTVAIMSVYILFERDVSKYLDPAKNLQPE